MMNTCRAEKIALLLAEVENGNEQAMVVKSIIENYYGNNFFLYPDNLRREAINRYNSLLTANVFDIELRRKLWIDK